MSAAEQAVAAAAAAAVAAAAAGTPQGGTSRPLIVTSGLPAATVTAAASIPVSAAQLASIPMSMALAGLPPGHPALAQVQQQVQAAMAQQVNVNVAQAMAQAAAQAAAAGVALPAGLHAQFQQQQQQLHQAAAAAAAAAVQAAHSHPPDTRGVPAPPPGPPAQGTPAAPHTAGLSLGTVDPQAAERAQKAAEAMARGNEWAAEPLFGGAMELELPLRFTDISKYRPVPDHQEVFADAHQDQSLVIEILEMAQVENKDSAHYFFEDLALQNEAQSHAMETVYTLSPSDVPNLPSNSVCTCALGYQTVAKARQTADTSNYVQIILGVVRLPQVQTDIVISLNTPAYINEKSASAEHAGSGAKSAYLRAPELFRRMLQSFRILDMSLFGSS